MDAVCVSTSVFIDGRVSGVYCSHYQISFSTNVPVSVGFVSQDFQIFLFSILFFLAFFIGVYVASNT